MLENIFKFKNKKGDDKKNNKTKPKKENVNIKIKKESKVETKQNNNKKPKQNDSKKPKQNDNRKLNQNNNQTKNNNKIKSNDKTKHNKNNSEFSEFSEEIQLFITLGIGVILFLSNFSICGKVGNLISGLLFGLFGAIAYVIPILFVVGMMFLIFNNYNSLSVNKFGLSFLLICMISTLFQMVTDINMDNVLNYYIEASINKKGGGILGGIICKFLYTCFGYGAYVIVILVILLTIILLSKKSLLKFIKSESKQIYKKAKDYKAEIEKEQKFEEKNIVEEDIYKVSIKDKILNLFSIDKDTYYDEEEQEKLENIKVNKNKITKKSKPSKKEVMENNLKSQNYKNSQVREQEEFYGERDVRDFFVTLGSKGEIPYTVDDNYIVNNYYDNNNINQIDNNDYEIDDSYNNEEKLDYKEKSESDILNKTDIKKTSKKSDVKKEKVKQKSSDVQNIVVKEQDNDEYVFPPISLLKENKNGNYKNIDSKLKIEGEKLKSTLESFNVKVSITGISKGPAVTRFEMQPEQGIKVSKIISLSDDIKLNLAATDIRIEAPIPGMSAIGIEVPNKEVSLVSFRELIEDEQFKNSKSKISFAVGKDISGQVIVTDIAKMPHLLIAGATGSGKSVCINTLIMSILYKARPDEVKMIMIDPKVVELSVYNGIPHLLIPVVTDPKKASSALNWVVAEMDSRYKKFEGMSGVRNLEGYNKKVKALIKSGEAKEGDGENDVKVLPQIVVIVDELADLMMVAPGDVENAIVRISQLARAAGIHLVIATQRPSVNVITGLIKANVPSRIAFAVSSGIDSRTILDSIGAEKLLGKGDMLFAPYGAPKPKRIQGAFISDSEVESVVEFFTQQFKTEYNDSITEEIEKSAKEIEKGNKALEYDEYFVEAGRFIIEKDKASIGMLQRMYKIGFNRAARIMDQLYEVGVVSAEEGTKPRKILMNMEEFNNFVEEYL